MIVVPSPLYELPDSPPALLPIPDPADTADGSPEYHEESHSINQLHFLSDPHPKPDRVYGAILKASGGESGNPYSGEGTTIIPDHPGNWS